MIRVTGRTAPGPRTWAGSIWAGTARPTAAWSPSPRCGLMSGSTTRCTRCRTPRRSTSRRGRTTRGSGPSCRSGRILRSGLRRRGSASGRSSRTAPTGTRTFRDGHAETWRAAGASLGGWGPDGVRRLVVATADPGTLPGKATWYLVTNLARPGGPREKDSPWPAASLAEIVRLYGIRHWTGQSCKQVKDELGWADFQVRSDVAIRRHQALVNCAFSFCWAAWFAEHPPQHDAAPQPGPGGGERGRRRRRTTAAGAVLAAGAARDPRLALPLDRAAALVAGMVQGAPAPAAASPDQLGRGRLRPAPLHPELTDYR